MRATAKIHWARCQHDPHTGWDRHHEAAARTARNTAVSVLVSIPLPTRTTVPPKSISISGTRGAVFTVFCSAVGGASIIGTNCGPVDTISEEASRNAARRHANTCCGQICQRRAICDTTAPGHHCLRRDPRLILNSPAPPPAGPGQNLNAPIATLSVVVNAIHNVSAKPPHASEPTIRNLPKPEEWPQSTAY
jgi:hypothetical protein